MEVKENSFKGNKCIFILGMHRSGTSALAGTLKILGFDLGDNLMPSNYYNKKGYFEDLDAYTLNDRILRYHNRSWDSILRLESNSVNHFTREIQEFYIDKFSKSSECVIKDPRISLFFPLWQRALEEIGVECHVIIALRNPIEVAESLEKRDGFSMNKSLLLWANHTLQIEQDTKSNVGRSFIFYDQFLKSPKDTLEEILNSVESKLQITDESYDEVKRFLDPSLKHHRVDIEQNAIGKLEWIVQIYEDYRSGHMKRSKIDDGISKLKHVLEQYYSEDIIETLSKDFNSDFSVLHIDSGFGYDGRNSIRQNYDLEKERFSFSYLRLEKYGELEKIRFQPVKDKFVKLKLVQIVSLDVSGKKLELDVKEIKSNGIVNGDNTLEFHTSDPWIEFILKSTITELKITGLIWSLDTRNVFRNIDNKLHQATKEAQRIEGLRKKLEGEKNTWFAETKKSIENSRKYLNEKNELLSKLNEHIFLLKKEAQNNIELNSKLVDLSNAYDIQKVKSEELESSLNTTREQHDDLEAKNKHLSHLLKQADYDKTQTGKRLQKVEMDYNKAKKRNESLLFFKQLYDDLPNLFSRRLIKSIFHRLDKFVSKETVIPDSYIYHPLVFNAEYYNSKNNLNLTQGLIKQHWMDTGIYQGIPSSKYFHVKHYLSKNVDLKKHFKRDYKGAIKHWLESGISEWRTTSPEIEFKIKPEQVDDLISKKYTSNNRKERDVLVKANKLIENRDWSEALAIWHQIIDSTTNLALKGRAKINISILKRLKDLDAYKKLIQEYQKSKNENANRIKVAVYSAIIGNYDSIKLPEVFDADVSYILFTDEPVFETGIWEVRPVDYNHHDKTRIARYVKTHPHTLLADYDLCIWIDSNIMLLDTLEPFIGEFLKSGKKVAALHHPERDSIYDEAQKCIEFSKDSSDQIKEQIEYYRSIGFEHNDLIESNFMIFDTRADEVHDFLDDWWSEIERFSKRDQLSLNYAMKKNGVKWFPLLTKKNSARNHGSFAFGAHGRHDDGMSQLLIDEMQCPSIAPDSKTRNILVFQFTPEKTSNAYYEEFPKSLRELGTKVICSVDWEEAYEAESGTIFMFHQLEPFYHAESEDQTKLRGLEFIEKLKKLKENDRKIVITWHNPLPHNRQFVEVDKWLYHQVGEIVDLYLIHLRAASSYIQEYTDKSKIAYIPHPSFYDKLNFNINRNDARKILGLGEDEFVFLSLGEIKPYKDHKLLINAWQEFKKANNSKSKLIVAGKLHDAESREIFENVPDLITRFEYIPDEEIENYLSSADISIYNHKEIWTSGAAILSMSRGLPVIMPRSVYTEEYVIHEDNGFLYDPNDAESLKNLMKEVVNNPLLKHISFNNKKQASRNTFKKISQGLSKILKQI